MLCGLVVSAGFGAWHFFIPYLFRWYSYIPNAPRTLLVSIDWTNFFLALLLCGTSVLLIVLHRRVLGGEPSAFAFYSFLTAVWLTRIVLTAVHPWQYDWMFAVQMAGFGLVFVLLLLPWLSLIRRRIDDRRPGAAPGSPAQDRECEVRGQARR